MSNTSIRPIPTLKGMFTVPRVTQGRNFLQENKKSLRSLEKTTTEKLAAKEPVRPKWMPPLRRTSSEAQETKRCQAENHAVSRQHENKPCQLGSRSNSRSQNSLNNNNQLSSESSEHYAPSEKRELQKAYSASQSEQLSERCQSCGIERSLTTIGIQTEDIMDELYLTNALKKCNFDGKSILSGGRNFYTGDDYDENYGNYNQYDDNDQPLSDRSKHSRLNMDDNEAMPMPHVNSLPIDNSDDEAPLSARSRATVGSMASNVTTKSKRGEHKLGSRDDLRLPRYLEKEKREKAEAKGRVEARDPDCPRGHVLLSEPDRLAALAGAKKRFDGLIYELNHMPMSAETLRVRSRKNEIEKELKSAEDEIRIYSKSKVYVKVTKSRNL
ncbi:uncharacterized protein LOC117784256 [Drosophila innubila]|uniref:uncharacterized protein LOC117784256 n=1 Tax=Drosophila innubila TaxID=198719 RepID=UPI00148DD43F|nr:uncharacterized protein LOC117784256 [Drosophila innubila]